MGMREDLRRFQEVGEERREDLAEFITYGDLGQSGPGTVRIPIKLVDLPEFRYDEPDMGGLGQADGDVQPGDPVEQPADDQTGEPGDEPGEHGYHEMDPEAFAEALDEELGLDLEPKGKTVIEEELADFTDIRRSGPRGLLDVDHLFRRGLKRKLVTDFDEEFVQEVLRVDGVGPDAAYRWARANHVPVSKRWLRDAYSTIPADERTKWRSIAEVEESIERRPVAHRIRESGLGRLPFRRDDERYRYPTIREQRLYDVVVVNIRDVSGSMREDKRELVERTFAPLDWYLQGKYDRAEFVYIAHDATAWQVDRESFFGIRSGGGTRISSAYELAAEVLEAEYPWAEWNRYVFAAGDSENATSDTKDRVIPLMEAIEANRHAYVETQPGGSSPNASHADEVADHFADAPNVTVAYVGEPGDVVGAVQDILEPTEVEAA